MQQQKNIHGQAEEKAKMAIAAVHPEAKLLLYLIDQAFDKPAWHGPNLRNSVRGLSADEAAWRPAPGRHNIWEVAVHAAYWKYVAARRLTGDKETGFPHKGTNWFSLPPPPDENSWREDIALLEQLHSSLREAVKGVPASELYKPARGSRQINATLIIGIASHDLYHAGQIRLLRRLREKA